MCNITFSNDILKVSVMVKWERARKYVFFFFLVKYYEKEVWQNDNCHVTLFKFNFDTSLLASALRMLLAATLCCQKVAAKLL